MENQMHIYSISRDSISHYLPRTAFQLGIQRGPRDHAPTPNSWPSEEKLWEYCCCRRESWFCFDVDSG